ncbi:hypothetical protein MIR68_004136 [Amoeboaphelidium protococcarum]|nr:hypothetical protein MIR68_004136 [Amoeboaphelidium protococcarum]
MILLILGKENLNLEDYGHSWQIVLIVLLSLANLLQSISHLPQLIANFKSKSSQALSDGFLFFGLIHGISLCCWQGLRSGFNIYLLAPIIYTFFAAALALQRIYHQFPRVPSLKSKSNGKLFDSLAAEQLVQVVPKYVMQYFALIIACYSALILRLDGTFVTLFVYLPTLTMLQFYHQVKYIRSSGPELNASMVIYILTFAPNLLSLAALIIVTSLRPSMLCIICWVLFCLNLLPPLLSSIIILRQLHIADRGRYDQAREELITH